MIRHGDLRDLVGFYQRATLGANSPDVPDYGNTVGEFPGTANFTAPAQIKPRLGGEAVLAGRLEGKNFVNVTVRQSSATSLVTTDWRAKNERTGEILNIRSIIDPDQATPQHGRFFELLAEKGVAT